MQAKLRYDPVELDPEDMCRMASEQPQVGYCTAYRQGIFRGSVHIVHVEVLIMHPSQAGCVRLVSVVSLLQQGNYCQIFTCQSMSTRTMRHYFKFSAHPP